MLTKLLLATVLVLLMFMIKFPGTQCRSPNRDLPRNHDWTGYGNQQHGESWKTNNNNRRQQRLKKPLPQRERKPNIIIILTDDQDIELGSMEYMPHAISILRDGGAYFPNAYVTTPMCCPSRSSLLTGMYVHNHNVFTNNDNCSSPHWQQHHETRSFATYLNNAGYRTGYFGKYLNEYNGTYIPPGWREWSGLIRNSRFYNYSINVNGKKIKHGDSYEKDYYPDLITNDSITFLRESKQYFGSKPVMMVLSYPSPHGPEDAAPQYQHLFFNNTSHRTLNWNYAPNPDKQWILRHTGKMEAIHIKFTDMLQTKRLQTLQSVDEGVARIYNELLNIGEAENTYIIYLSDHGYHLGQFGLVKGKAMPYEFDVKIPFFIKGPNVPKGVRIPNIVLNIDVAPTLLDIAGVEIPEHMDGKSVLKLLMEANEIYSNGRHHIDMEQRRRKTWRDTFLIESAGRRPADRDSIRYDDRLFPYHGATYQETTLTKDRKLFYQCQHPQFQSPCKPGQKWQCGHDGGRWRVYKCRTHDRSYNRKNCICPKDITNHDVPSHVAEENAQREFIRHHVKKDFNPRFLRIRETRNISLLRKLAMTQENEESVNDEPYDDSVEESEENLDEMDMLDLEEDLQDQEEQDSVNFEHSEEATWEYPDIDAAEISMKHISNVTQDVSQGFSTDNPFLEDHKITERSLKSHLQKIDCAVLNGTVNCSESVYQDQETWRRNSEMTKNRIKQLKNELDLQKGIRVHLKENRPTTKPIEFTSTEPYVVPSKHSHVTQDSPKRNGFRLPSKPCNCKHPFGSGSSLRDQLREERRRIKEERLRIKERKNKKKAKYNNTTCNAEKMNCFTHDNHHWKTPPLWTYGPFCFCQNANNNTYWCLRTINETHNFLYCEFVTRFVMFFDMNNDLYQMHNIVDTLPDGVLSQLQNQLLRLRECEGAKKCTVRSSTIPGRRTYARDRPVPQNRPNSVMS